MKGLLGVAAGVALAAASPIAAVCAIPVLLGAYAWADKGVKHYEKLERMTDAERLAHYHRTGE